KLQNIVKVYEELTGKACTLNGADSGHGCGERDARYGKAMETLGRGVADAEERLKGLRETLSFREKGVILR
ncbi:MAG: hypothetical protein ACUVQ6_01230, partial [Dissulfurimicrobium sp.]|uniref:hypothetical protein n=1 Tax=Dissulfurimicrobium sp. TaxID=2022436 RepID=UPI0040498635